MSLADDLMKLEQLRSSGSLSEAEFELAKKKLLAPEQEGDWRDERRFLSDDQEKRKFVSSVFDNEEQSLGNAANRYVSYQMISSILGFIVFLIFLFVVVLPTSCRSHFSGNSGSVERSNRYLGSFGSHK